MPTGRDANKEALVGLVCMASATLGAFLVGAESRNIFGLIGAALWAVTAFIMGRMSK